MRIVFQPAAPNGRDIETCTSRGRSTSMRNEFSPAPLSCCDAVARGGLGATTCACAGAVPSALHDAPAATTTTTEPASFDQAFMRESSILARSIADRKLAAQVFARKVR